MNFSIGRLLLWGVLAIGSAGAVEIRNYQPARHDRFSGDVSQPAWNENAWFKSSRFSGVGWAPDVADGRQYVLVSPSHVLCAGHHVPAPGSVIRFLGVNGTVVQRTVAGHRFVPGKEGNLADLAVVVLSEPVFGNEGVATFPYLNLDGEAAYKGTSLVVFGRSLKVGAGILGSINDLTQVGFGPTRVMRFTYRKAFGNQDDCYLTLGDSGSPTFAMVGERPAVLGVHVAAEDSLVFRTSVDTFIPAYIPELNGLMAMEGYQMTPVYLLPADLQVSAEVASAAFRQAEGGSVFLRLQNAAAREAGNVRIRLKFEDGQGPVSVLSAGWVVEQAGPDLWSFRRANVPAGESVVLTALWDELPVEPAVMVETRVSSENGAERVSDFSLPLTEGYAGWSKFLQQPGQQQDPDGDGVPNLLEFAFGGDPGDAGSVSVDGSSFLHLERKGSQGVVSFPVRTDAAARGVSYVLEYSESLTGWSEVPVGGPVEQRALVPVVEGFVQRQVIVETAVAKGFFRVRVDLD